MMSCNNRLMGIAPRSARNVLLLAIVSVSISACGGGGGDGDVRTVDLSGADAPASLFLPDDAAKILSTNLEGLFATSIMYNKALDTVSTEPGTSNCLTSGTQKFEYSASGGADIYTFTFNQCLDETWFYDGLLKVEESSSGEVFNGSRTYGTSSSNGTILTEDRGSAQRRDVIMGTYSATDLPGNTTQRDLNLRGRVEKLSGTPSQSYQLDQYKIVTKNTDQQVRSINYSGMLTLKGTCTTGKSTISTPSDLQTDGSGGFTGGQMVISSGNNSATITFNSNKSITIAAPGGSKTYTDAQIRSICGV
mgnify:CR=1 FL=1|jgi:hypothetical protein